MSSAPPVECLFTPYVGRASRPMVHEIERGHVRRFVEAIGDPNPIYVDEEAARRAGHPRIPAPPTFAAALRPNDAREGIEIDWKRLLHGEQEFVFERPLYVGDRLTLVQRIADAYAKQGKAGIMDMMVLETEAHDDFGTLAYRTRALIVVRR